MASGERGVAVAREDDLALLGELETAVDRAFGLREHRSVGGTATTSDRAAAPVHEDEVDVILLGPLRDLPLGAMEDERRRGGAGVLGGVGVAEHDLEPPAGLREAALHVGQGDDPVEGGNGVLEVGHLLEERNHVEHGHVGLMGEGETCELVHVGDVLGALREGDDVAASGVDAVLPLDGADGAEGVEDLARHGLELSPLAPAPVLADVGEGSRVHDRVLAELHLDHVEAEGLRLPDDLLERAVGRAGGARLGERALHDDEVVHVLVGALVHEVRRALDGGVEAIGDDEHGGAVHLVGGDLERVRGERLAHLHLVAPEVDELLGRWRRHRVEREVPAHVTGALGEGLEHVRAELLGDLAAHPGGDVGVAVAVGAYPAAGMEEGGADGRHGAGLLAKLPVVEAAVDLRDHVEERAVEDVDDGVGLLDGGRLLVGDRGRAEERVDLLEHEPLVLPELDAREVGAPVEKDGDAPDLALDRLAAGLRGMRGEHRPELEPAEQGERLAATALVDEPVVGDGDVVDRVLVRPHGHVVLAGPQGRDAVVLLADVGKVEVGDERPHDDRGLLGGHLVDGRDETHEGLVLAAGLARLVTMGRDGVLEQRVEGVAQAGVVLLENLADQPQEEGQVVADSLRQVNLGEGHAGRCRLEVGSL